MFMVIKKVVGPGDRRRHLYIYELGSAATGAWIFFKSTP